MPRRTPGSKRSRRGAVQRPGAVVTDAHRHAGVVEDLADIVGVNPSTTKATEPDRRVASTGAEDAHPGRWASPSSAASTSSCSWACTRSIPSPSRYSQAAASPTAWAAMGTPASKRCGGGAGRLSIRTSSIIEPPVRKGGISSSRARAPERP